MTPVQTFRLLIILEVVFILCGVVAGYFTVDGLPATLQEYLSDPDWGIFSGIDTDTTGYWIILGAIVLVWIAVSIALFCFWRPARTLYVLLTVLGIGLYPFTGPTVETPLESTFFFMSALCTGGVLAFLYWSPVKERFEARQS